MKDAKVYLQLEEDELVAKIEPIDATNGRTLREHWSRLITRGIAEPRFLRPKRFGSGRWMTVARLDGAYRVGRDDGTIDLDETIALLRRASTTVRALATQDERR